MIDNRKESINHEAYGIVSETDGNPRVTEEGTADANSNLTPNNDKLDTGNNEFA